MAKFGREPFTALDKPSREIYEADGLDDNQHIQYDDESSVVNKLKLPGKIGGA